MIDKVKELTKCPIKYCFIDIETISDKMPNILTAEAPVGCIRIYNSQSEKRQTFRLDQYDNEYEMLDDFIKYMKKEKFDLWLSWNVAFDYNYLHNRIPDFAQKISPIGQTRYGGEDLQYPAGISIVDYLEWFKKVTLNKARSYKLDSVGEEFLGHGKEFNKVDFSTLNEELIKRNMEDVELMVELEEKFQMIPYFDEIRRMSKVEWEDMKWNSRIIDMLLLQEARSQKIVLPMKQENEKEEFEGAYREAFQTGRFYEIGKYDLASAYPNMIIDFCLDPANIVPAEYNSESALEIEGAMFEQNPKALLPTICKKLLELKSQIKKKLKALDANTPEKTDMQRKYDAIKTIVNSAYGVMGNRFFRLYDKKVASATTFLVRHVLHYVKNRVEEDGRKIIYVDTDSVFIEGSEDLTDYLNGLIKEWAEGWNKEQISTDFDHEGTFEKLLILAKCRYIGYIRKFNAVKQMDELEEEVKGVEAKRKDSTKFMKDFQKILINKILDKEAKEDIFSWITSEIERMRNLPLSEIAFPCKLGRERSKYANTPIFLRALDNTPGFNKKVGEDFYYIYVEPRYEVIEKPVIEYYREVPGKRAGTTKKEKLTKKKLEELCNSTNEGFYTTEEKLIEQGIIKKSERIAKTKKAHDVKAFDEETQDAITDVDWEKMINRNVFMKLETIFGAMEWDVNDVKNQSLVS